MSGIVRRYAHGHAITDENPDLEAFDFSAKPGQDVHTVLELDLVIAAPGNICDSSFELD